MLTSELRFSLLCIFYLISPFFIFRRLLLLLRYSLFGMQHTSLNNFIRKRK